MSKSILDGLNTKQELALYLRCGRSLVEKLEGKGLVNTAVLLQLVAGHKLELVDEPPAVTMGVQP